MEPVAFSSASSCAPCVDVRPSNGVRRCPPGCFEESCSCFEFPFGASVKQMRCRRSFGHPSVHAMHVLSIRLLCHSWPPSSSPSRSRCKERSPSCLPKSPSSLQTRDWSSYDVFKERMFHLFDSLQIASLIEAQGAMLNIAGGFFAFLKRSVSPAAIDTFSSHTFARGQISPKPTFRS